MVDPVNGAGGLQNVGQVRTQNNRNSDVSGGADVGASAPADQVSVSDAALETQALENAQQIRAALEQDTSAGLSSDAGRINQLL